MKRRSAILAVAAAAGLRVSSAGAEPPDLAPEQARGHELFHQSCVYCHGPRGFATRTLAGRLGEARGLLEERRDLNPQYIRFVVRRGLNSMPWYRRTELTDAELASIVAYLTRPREHPAEEPSP